MKYHLSTNTFHVYFFCLNVKQWSNNESSFNIRLNFNILNVSFDQSNVSVWINGKRSYVYLQNNNLIFGSCAFQLSSIFCWSGHSSGTFNRILYLIYVIWLFWFCCLCLEMSCSVLVLLSYYQSSFHLAYITQNRNWIYNYYASKFTNQGFHPLGYYSMPQASFHSKLEILIYLAI